MSSPPDLNKVAKAAASEKKKKAPAVVAAESDEIPSFVDDEADAKSLYIERQRQEIADLRALATQRALYAGRLFRLISAWLLGVFVVLMCSGLGEHWFGATVTWFKLSDGVIIAYLGTTTLNVLGLFVIVANWLFPKPSNGKSESK